MATENDSTTGTEGTETGQQEQQGQQQSTTTETVGQEQQQASTEPVRLTDDHPLVKTLAKQKSDLASQKSEIAELKATSAKVSQLEEELTTRPTQEAVDAVQTRYDRLESFLQAVGGPLGKALDSKSFTTQLFESDKDINDIVKDWNKANPTATASALGSGGAAPAAKAPGINDLLRAAVNK